MENKRKLKTAVVFIAVIFIMPLIFIFSRKESFSPEENRSLKKLPEISAESIADKSFMEDMEEYLSDHFPARLTFETAKLTAERLSGKNCVNDIYITEDRLIQKLPEPDYDKMNLSVSAINQFSEKYNTSVYVSVVPTSAGIYRDEIGSYSPQINQHKLIKNIYSGFDSSVTAIDVYDVLSSEADQYIYYRNDHHWTSYGAYTAYRTIISKLGFQAVQEDSYDIEHAANDFRGTFYSKCLYKGTAADVIDIYSCKNGYEVESVTMNDGAEVTEADDIYFREYLDGSDKYCVFLGQNRAFTDIKTNAQSDKSILIIKDSYANSLVPFLVQHYSRISVVDPRYIKGTIEDFTDPDQYDQVLFLYNASTFSEDDNIKSIVK